MKLKTEKLINTWQDQLFVEFDLHVLALEDFQTALNNRDYDLVLYGQNFTDNFDVLSLWHSSQSGQLNLANFTRDDVDFLIDEIRFSGATQDYQALQDTLDELAPVLTLATPEYQVFWASNLKGTLQNWDKIQSLPHRFANVGQWHFQTHQAWDLPDEKWPIYWFFRWLLDGRSLS